MNINKDNSGFIFGTWNAGSDVGDYIQLIKGKEIKEEIFDKEPQADLEKLRNTFSKIRDDLLTDATENLGKQADVIALQEVAGDDRADIQALKNLGFEIIRPKRKVADMSDTAVAINPKKFENIENRSFQNNVAEFAIAVAIEKETGKKIAFISGHIDAFNLEENQEKLNAAGSHGDKTITSLLEN